MARNKFAITFKRAGSLGGVLISSEYWNLSKTKNKSTIEKFRKFHETSLWKTLKQYTRYNYNFSREIRVFVKAQR